MAVIRSFLMAADVTASAMADPDFPSGESPLDEEMIGRWVKTNLTDVIPKPADYRKVVESKEKGIGKAKNKKPSDEMVNIDKERKEFQTRVAESKKLVTLVTAGCGSGKTLAAFRWGLNHCSENGDRLFFCYPTTGTATEGFLDYLLDDENNSFGNLIHSRVAVDFLLNERMRYDDTTPVADIIRSLNLWGTGLVCCTVDTVLGFLVNTYAGHLSWPAFARSIFVFDEIHSYDDTLFGYLIRFLQTFRGVPILLMTASLPKHRVEHLQVVTGPVTWERIKRYRRIETDREPIEKALEHYRSGEKILWVCNTVGRAVKFAKEIRNHEPDCRLIVYHSHFKYEDRVKRHGECIESFRRNEPVICVATQVAEMSLDISADFLITDLAPIPALIQRLGRLNRRAVTDNPKPFLIHFPYDENGKSYLLPYGEESPWWEESNKWLEELNENSLSQSDLTEAWETVAKGESVIPDLPSSCYWTAPLEMNHGNLRALSPTCDVVLKEDLDEIRRKGKTAYLMKVIPMTRPRKNSQMLVKISRDGYVVAERDHGITYDPKFGGEWKSTPDGIEGTIIV
jgi:CRISPR-associated endonuclease/helicase Cas3